jgi:glycosyltransferase involved in cell wall biosynthesis
LAQALKKSGVDLDIFCHTDGGEPKEPHIHPIIDMKRSDWQDILFHTVELKNPDIIHIQHEYGLYTLKKDQYFDFSPASSFRMAEILFKWQTIRRPVVVTYHSVYSKMTFDEVMYNRYFSELTTASIVHENFQKLSLLNYFGKHEAKNIFTIPHGAWSKQAADKEKVKLEQGWDDKLVVGMIGFLEHTKGFERIIKLWPDVVKKIPNALLVIEGNARPGSPTGLESLNKIVKIIESCPVKKNIKFIRKYFEWPENNQFISGFDVMVLPYLFASQSGNLAHGYGAGLPVVAANLEGIASSVNTSRAGILAKNDPEFLEAIIKLLKNASMRNVFAKNSANYATKIDWLVTAKKHIDVYNYAIQKTNKENKVIVSKFLGKRTHV